MKNLPFWFPNKKNFYWYILFIFIFILSIDIWAWDLDEPKILGLPFWIYYLIILTLITSFAFYIFANKYWEDKK